MSSLKDLGYVDELSAGCEEEANGFDFFDITCDLTEDGVGMYFFLSFKIRPISKFLLLELKVNNDFSDMIKSKKCIVWYIYN